MLRLGGSKHEFVDSKLSQEEARWNTSSFYLTCCLTCSSIQATSELTQTRSGRYSTVSRNSYTVNNGKWSRCYRQGTKSTLEYGTKITSLRWWKREVKAGGGTKAGGFLWTHSERNNHFAISAWGNPSYRCVQLAFITSSSHCKGEICAEDTASSDLSTLTSLSILAAYVILTSTLKLWSIVLDMNEAIDNNLCQN